MGKLSTHANEESQNKEYTQKRKKYNEEEEEEGEDCFQHQKEDGNPKNINQTIWKAANILGVPSIQKPVSFLDESEEDDYSSEFVGGDDGDEIWCECLVQLALQHSL